MWHPEAEQDVGEEARPRPNVEVVLAMRPPRRYGSLDEHLEENIFSFVIHDRSCPSSAIWVLMKMAH